jgi:hypothetical protein
VSTDDNTCESYDAEENPVRCGCCIKCLRADRERLTTKVAELEQTLSLRCADALTVDAELMAARGEVARLREALVPFAAEAATWSDDPTLTAKRPVAVQHFTIGDLRRASAALSGSPSPLVEENRRLRHGLAHVAEGRHRRCALDRCGILDAALSQPTASDDTNGGA